MEGNETYKLKLEDRMNTDNATNKEEVMEVDAIRTGTVRASEIFRDILSRKKLRNLETPRTHSAPTSPAANVTILDLTWDEASARSVKRRREDGRNNDEDEEKDSMENNKKMATKVRQIINELDKEVRGVAEIAKERNVKREIKEGTSRLRSLMSQLMTRNVQALLQTLGRNIEGVAEPDKDREEEEKERQIQELKSKMEIINKKLGEKDQKLQTLKGEKMKLEEENRKLREEVKTLKKAEEKVHVEEKMFTESDSYEKFLELEKMKWDKGIYKVAFYAEGSPLAAGRDTDILTLHEEGTEKYSTKANEALERSFKDRYPELKDLDDKIAAITINTKVMKIGEETTETNKWIIRTEIDLEGGGREWFNTLKNIRDLVVKHGRAKLAVYPPSPDPEGTLTRKMLEYIFKKTNVKCLIHTRPQGGENKSQGSSSHKRDTDALIISQEGKSYSDLLKTLKQTVQPGTAPARAIRTIRESKDGKMIVVLDKDNKATEELREKISGVREIKIKTTSGDNKKTVFIYDVDGLTTPEEVITAICGETKLTPEDIQIGDLRKSFAGNQMAIVKLPAEVSEQILRKGRLRIGLSWCPIKERVEVLRCFRCWRYGHIVKECKE